MVEDSRRRSDGNHRIAEALARLCAAPIPVLTSSASSWAPLSRPEPAQPGARLPAPIGRRGSALGGAALDRAVDAQHAEGLLGDARFDALHLVQGQPLQRNTPLGGERDD